jgi:hypothetical protein
VHRSADARRAAARGNGYRYEFVVPQGSPPHRTTCGEVTTQAIRRSVNGGAFRFARG